MGIIRHFIEWASIGIEVVAVAFIVASVAFLTATQGTVRYVFKLGREEAVESYRRSLGKALLLGLELLVAADVVRTVALEPTLNNVGVLGLLVLVRTFLSWSMVVEMEGRWPWQPRSSAAHSTGQGTRGM